MELCEMIKLKEKLESKKTKTQKIRRWISDLEKFIEEAQTRIQKEKYV